MREPVLNQRSDTLREKRRTRRPSGGFTAFRGLQSVLTVALLVASVLTFWSPDNLFTNNIFSRLLSNMENAAPSQPQSAPEPLPTPSGKLRVGIVSGHWGNDSGATCSDGLTEEQVNLEIAQRVSASLQNEGYDVNLLKEFDPALTGYQAVALVSIHNDSCDFINDQATGFKVAGASGMEQPEKAERLVACLSNRYQQETGMLFHDHTVTPDMTDYHAFSEIDGNTPAAIIETGFLNLDREILTQQPDRIAAGITAGILCYIRNEDVSTEPVQKAP